MKILKQKQNKIRVGKVGKWLRWRYWLMSIADWQLTDWNLSSFIHFINNFLAKMINCWLTCKYHYYYDDIFQIILHRRHLSYVFVCERIWRTKKTSNWWCEWMNEWMISSFCCDNFVVCLLFSFVCLLKFCLCLCFFPNIFIS